MPSLGNTLKRIQNSTGLVICALVGVLASHMAIAGTVAGKIIFTIGNVYMLTPEGNRALPLTSGDSISEAETIATGADGYAHIRMSDDAFIALRPDSILRIDEYSFAIDAKENDRVKISLLKGKLRSVSGKVAKRSKERYRLNTPVAAIGVRGTDYTVITTAEQSQVDVLQGGIAMSPFNEQCKATALGPCQGDSVVDLYAEMKQHYLQLSARDRVPDLIEGRLINLSHPEDSNSLQKIRPALTANQTTPDETAETDSTDAEQPAAKTDSTDAEQPTAKTDSADTEQPAAKTDNADAEQSAAKTDNTDAEQPAAKTDSAGQEVTYTEGVDTISSTPPSDSETKLDMGNDENIRETLDSDGDGVSDFIDAFPDDPNEQLDSDQDGVGNNQDPDDDNDGLSDEREYLSGSNPLLNDTDGDGVSDLKDSRPLSNAGVSLQTMGKTVTLSEAEFSGLTVNAITLSQLTGSNVTGKILQQTMQLKPNTANETEPYLTMSRNTDNSGRTFWGSAGTAEAWDYKARYSLHTDSMLGNPDTASSISMNNSWDVYYQPSDYLPLVKNDSLYLSHVNGLTPTTTPELNQSFPTLGLLYDLSASEITLLDSQGNAQQASIIDFDFKMNYKNQTFEAELIAKDNSGSPVSIRFDGAVNKSGMVFGGDADAYLKGFFINQMRQVALIFEAQSNGQAYSGTLIVDRNYRLAWGGKLEKTFARYQTADNAPVTWGRWSNFSEITSPDDFASQLKGEQLIAHNRMFALMRSENQTINLPTEGVYSFELDAAEAVYRQGIYTETASIANPSLTVNFNDSTFTTALRVTAPSISHGVAITAGGSVQDDGLFFSNQEHSNSTVSGAIHNDGTGATMIFERDLDEDSYVSGAVDWTR